MANLRLDYQPLFGKMSPHSSKTGPGRRWKSSLGKPLLAGSALGSDKFRNICDMETIPPETDVLINNAHFPSFTSPKFPFRRS